MSAGAPWSVKGIDPKAREVAKELARRSGMTLGEWLNRVILEDDDPDQIAALAPPPVAQLRPDLSAGFASHGAELPVRQTVARLETAAEAQARLNERISNLEARFETLASGLARDVQGVRSEFAVRLAQSPGGETEQRLAGLALRIQAAERHGRESVDRIGREVISMAEAVNRRLAATEERSAEAIDLVGSEIARIAGAVEARLARAEHAQAEALQRLGDEVTRVTDRFAERLEGAERRSASAIEGVGEQVSRLTERLEQRHARTADDLAERIRQSEVRTAAILHAAAPEPEPSARADVSPEFFSRAAADDDDPPPVAAFAPNIPRADFDAEGGFAPLTETDDDIFTAEVLEEPADAGLSTREVIERARAAVRAAQDSAERATEIPPKPALEVRAKVARQAASGGFFAGFGQPKARRPAATPGLHTALMVAGGAAFLSVGAAGVVLMEGEGGHGQQAAYSPIGPSPRAAVALAPAVSAPTPDLGDSEAAYAEAVQAIAARRPGALARLKALADQGYGPAQLHMAGLYETGEAGVVRNMAEVRRWTALAAEGGSPKAMHNLAVYYFHGDGGPKDLSSAALWFRKAAELGVVESQYNLGMLYQSGTGVQKDLAEARKWFDLAAVQGDAQARRAADALTPAPVDAAASMNVPTTKRVLARLGYYNGPLDAAATPAYKAALADYQRDQASAVRR